MQYYFHIVSEQETVNDDEGLDLPSLATAIAEGMRSAGALAAEEYLSWGRPSRSYVEIVDSAGNRIGAVPFPALSSVIPFPGAS